MSIIRDFEEAVKVLNDMVAEGVIEQYAIGGGVATMMHVEAIMTMDLDAFVEPTATASGLVSFERVFRYLSERGYDEFSNNCVLIEGIPVDFVPPDALAAEAVECAIPAIVGSTSFMVFRPEYLLAIYRKIRRPKDMAKADAIMKECPIDMDLADDIFRRHGVKWL